MSDPTNNEVVEPTETVEKVEQPSYLAMSDEELLAAGPPSFEKTAVEPKEKTEEVVEPKDPVDPEAKVENDPENKALDADAKDGGKPADKEAGKPGEKTEVVEKEPKVPTDPKTEVPADKEDPAKDGAKVDFESEYKKLLAPFKANGRDIQVKNVDDAIALMQMGANYNKKMAALKPNLKLMKMLETSGFMDEEKIGFLIDLGKKDPAAINKLVKDAGIDPMDLDGEKASGYKPTTRTVDDHEIDLDTVLDELSDSPSYNQTLKVVGTKWDAASKQVISKSPQLLKVIDGHIQSGIYDLIAKELESERMFGRLSGLSDIEAYRQVGDAIQARGGFNHLGSSQGKTETKPVVVTPKPKVEDDKLKDKRRAASSTKPAAPGSTPKDFNPLSMSDEDFSKVGINKFL